MENEDINADVIKNKKTFISLYFKNIQIIIILIVILIVFGAKMLNENPALKVLILNKNAREYWMNLLYDEMYIAGKMDNYYLYKNKIPNDDTIHSLACQGMLNGYGNQYNYFLTKAQKDEFYNSTEGSEMYGLVCTIEVFYEKTNEGNPNYNNLAEFKLKKIQSGSPLEKAGLKPNDIILQVNDFIFEKYENYLSEEEKQNKIFVSYNANRGFGVSEPLRILTPLGDTKICNGNSSHIMYFGTKLKSYPEICKLLTDDQIKMIKYPEINLKVLRYNDETDGWDVISCNLKKQTFKFSAVEDAIITNDSNNIIGYVKLENFSKSGGKEFKASLNELIKKHVNSLIIDLRDNPGGFTDVLDDLLTLFIKNETLYEFKGRSKGTNKIIKAKDINFKTDIPLVVLVNEDSISCSEIFARVMQNLKRGVVIGLQTKGKGVIQNVYNLPTGSELRVVIAEWFVGGVSINNSGVKPDIYAEGNLNKNDFDAIYNLDADIALNAAINHLSGSKKK